MNLLFASDSFKGTLSSARTAELLEKAAREVFEEVTCSSVPVADGGEGTVEAVITAERGEMLSAKVHGPLMEEVTASYGKISDSKAIIEMAAASGLPMVPREKRNPLHTTTFGTGELILDALERGFRDISIAIGGSATNDGGMGCLRALGIRFLNIVLYLLVGNRHIGLIEPCRVQFASLNGIVHGVCKFTEEFLHSGDGRLQFILGILGRQRFGVIPARSSRPFASGQEEHQG